MTTVEINPTSTMDLLSQQEVELLKQSSSSQLYSTFRNCALAVLNCGCETDNVADILDAHKDFDIRIIQLDRGVKLELINPPKIAFVDGEIIQGIKEHLFAVLRDILFVAVTYEARLENATNSLQITNLVFDILRNAKVIRAKIDPSIVVCWGGHAITPKEYKYSKKIGYQLGLRGLNICTGCGPGAMKGPMKGATIGHSKQRIYSSLYIGLSEPSIIAAEPPNPIVNHLIILPDIEKRLEAFVRLGHVLIVLPGGAGTAEELLYILGILLHPKNQHLKLPIILTGPQSSADYFSALDTFIGASLGPEAQRLYRIILDHPEHVALAAIQGMEEVRNQRRHSSDAYHFNWALHIDQKFQIPFEPNHTNMSQLKLHQNQSKTDLACTLRQAFSGIVAGNIKPHVMSQIAQHGPFNLHGDPVLMALLDQLLLQFITQGRMKLPGSHYEPCYFIHAH